MNKTNANSKSDTCYLVCSFSVRLAVCGPWTLKTSGSHQRQVSFFSPMSMTFTVIWSKMVHTQFPLILQRGLYIKKNKNNLVVIHNWMQIME